MTIQPVESAPAPEYPDKYAEETRRALASARPRRWLSAPLAVGVLSATVALGLSGCAERVTMGDPIQIPIETVVPGDMEYVTMGMLPMPISNSVIPLFEYGDGTGSIGCMSIAAPVFMSEEEAYAILSAAFAEAGLTLEREAGTLEGATLPLTKLFEFVENTNGETTDYYATVPGILVPDGSLAELGLPVEFVSVNDVADWDDKSGPQASVMEYNVKKTARTLVENNPGLVVFYDPMASTDIDRLMSLRQEEGESDEAYYARCDTAHKETAQITRAESERLLRQQAEDFVEWLRGEGLL